MKIYVRCLRCDARRVLHRLLSEYIRTPACKLCGNRTYRRVKKTKQITCYCDGYYWPHRSGSPDCYFDRDGSDKPESFWRDRAGE